MAGETTIATAQYTVWGARLATDGKVDVELSRTDGGGGSQYIRVDEADLPPFRATVEGTFRVVSEPGA